MIILFFKLVFVIQTTPLQHSMNRYLFQNTNPVIIFQIAKYTAL